MFHVTEVVAVGSTTTERVRKHREALQAAGSKPIQIWIPDTRSESFRRQCEQESLLLAGDRTEAEMMAWIAEVADTNGWV